MGPVIFIIVVVKCINLLDLLIDNFAQNGDFLSFQDGQFLLHFDYECFDFFLDVGNEF